MSLCALTNFINLFTFFLPFLCVKLFFICLKISNKLSVCLLFFLSCISLLNPSTKDIPSFCQESTISGNGPLVGQLKIGTSWSPFHNFAFWVNLIKTQDGDFHILFYFDNVWVRLALKFHLNVAATSIELFSFCFTYGPR